MWTVAKYLGVLVLGMMTGAGVILFGGESLRKKISGGMHAAEKLVGGAK